MLDTPRPLAVITGSTSGLGEEFAMRLAADGYDLLLVARRMEFLKRQKTELEKQYGGVVEILAVDLADPEQLLTLERRLAESDRLEFLVNNAGFGFENTFPNTDIELECRMLQVHAVAPLRLTYAALGPMMHRKKGYIINVASVAAYLYGSACAQYMATKAYLLSFSKCLQCDVREHGIKIQALCPGLVHTGFHRAEFMNEDKYKKIPEFLWLDRKSVVRESLGNIRRLRRNTVCIPSWRYKFFLAILTCPLLTWLTERIYRKRAKM